MEALPIVALDALPGVPAVIQQSALRFCRDLVPRTDEDIVDLCLDPHFVRLIADAVREFELCASGVAGESDEAALYGYEAKADTLRLRKSVLEAVRRPRKKGRTSERLARLLSEELGIVDSSPDGLECVIETIVSRLRTVEQARSDIDRNQRSYFV